MSTTLIATNASPAIKPLYILLGINADKIRPNIHKKQSSDTGQQAKMASVDDLIASFAGGAHVGQEAYDIKALQVSGVSSGGVCGP